MAQRLLWELTSPCSSEAARWGLVTLRLRETQRWGPSEQLLGGDLALQISAGSQRQI